MFLLILSIQQVVAAAEAPEDASDSECTCAKFACPPCICPPCDLSRSTADFAFEQWRQARESHSKCYLGELQKEYGFYQRQIHKIYASSELVADVANQFIVYLRPYFTFAKERRLDDYEKHLANLNDTMTIVLYYIERVASSSGSIITSEMPKYAPTIDHQRSLIARYSSMLTIAALRSTMLQTSVLEASLAIEKLWVYTESFSNGYLTTDYGRFPVIYSNTVLVAVRQLVDVSQLSVFVETPCDTR